MNLGDTLQAPSTLASGRFFRVGYLPTYAASAFLLVLIWAGAPGRQVNFSRAWLTANHLGGVQVLLIALGIALAAVLLQPLQLSIVRILEGGFPGSTAAGKVQVARKHALETKVQGKIDEAVKLNAPRDATARDQLVQEAGALSERLRTRFPSRDHLVRGTGLGNALAALEDSAGAAYGLDAVVAWPRLYPVLGDRVRGIVDDLRDSMDAAVRLAATSTITAIASVALLAWHSGLLTLMFLAPLGVAAVAYVGAVQAAVAYGTAVHAAFDLHRLDLLKALHLELPGEPKQERPANVALSDFLRQGVPVPFTYSDYQNGGSHEL